MNPIPQHITTFEAWLFVASLLVCGAGLGLAFAAFTSRPLDDEEDL